MRLKDYNRRRKLQQGGYFDHVRPSYAKKGFEDREAFIMGMNPNIPFTPDSNVTIPYRMNQSELYRINQSELSPSQKTNPWFGQSNPIGFTYVDPVGVDGQTIKSPQANKQGIQSQNVNPVGVSNGVAPSNDIRGVSVPDSPELSQPSEGALAPGSTGVNVANIAMQFLPDLINLGTGLLGKDKTPEAVTVPNTSVARMPSRYNINPMLESNRAGYSAILSDPSATINQKLAAQVAKQRADQIAYAEKLNREAQMDADKASLQANIDAQNAQYEARAREDRMAIEANLGLAGNFARQALSNISTKGLQMIAESNKKEATDKQLMAILSGLDPEVRQRILNSLE
jgi:hypothetical protein